jgi:ADP-dependent NAD(P)H-hydrate dehydratase / NAD(P)H-hydrate epimerase
MALVLTAAQMRAVDRAAIEGLGLPGLVLMENAGRGTVEALARLRPRLGGCRCAVVCGAGQNGGDGFVIARHLAGRGAAVKVYLVAPKARVSGDARVFLEVAERLGLAIEERATDEDPASWTARLTGVEVIVDAIFGTGLRAEVRGAPAAAIAAINATSAFRVAVDIPSGRDADSGQVHGIAVAADLTATMGALKPGLLLDAAAPVGSLTVVDLGVAMEPFVPTATALGPVCHYLEAAAVAALSPRSTAAGHKGTRGHALVIAGSAGKTGAAVLSARGALRAGAGLVTIASTREGQEALDAKVLEPMTACYAGGPDADEQSYEQIAELGRRMQAAALGPGIPTGAGTRALVCRLAAELPLPLVIDADGLNHLGTEASAWLSRAPAPRVLTPHPGEMARLLGRETSEVQGDRLGACRGLAATTGAVVVLKGARTVIATPDGSAWINPAADPALGTAGSGDVLTGVIAGLLAQRLSPDAAARLGVFAHGESAAEARRALDTSNLLAGDLPEAVARVLERLSRLRGEPPPQR